MSLLLLGVSRPESGFVIDQVGVSAEVAYGLRKLRSAYSGQCIRIRESGANMETDIGFLANGDLDTAAIFAFCAGLWDAFIVTWYDQSGNTRNVTQSTAGNQPRIATAGVVPTLGGKPTATFDGVTQFVGQTGINITALFANGVHQPSAVTATQTIIRQNATISGTQWHLRLDAAATTFLRNPTVASGGTTTAAAQVSSATSTNGANSQVFRNGTSVATSAAMGSGATNGTVNIGVSPSGGQNYGGSIAEVLVFASNLTTTQRQTLERNQGSYFGITVA